MGATINAIAGLFGRQPPPPADAVMTPAMARKLLSDTRGLSNEQIDAAERVLSAFRASKPSGGCRCGACLWLEHTANDDSTWACAACHLPPMDDEQWATHKAAKAATEAAQAAEAKRAAAAETARLAATPKPRVALADALKELTEARASQAKLTAAAPIGWAAVSTQREAVDAAEAALELARGKAADAAVAALLEPAEASRRKGGAALGLRRSLPLRKRWQRRRRATNWP